jgi:hypothetical protein
MMMMPGMTAFDVSALRSALPPSVQTPQQFQQHQQQHAPMAAATATAGWAADFMNASLGGDLELPQKEQAAASTSAQIATTLGGAPQQSMQSPAANMGMMHSPPPLMQSTLVFIFWFEFNLK